MNEQRVKALKRILEVAEDYSILFPDNKKGLRFYEAVPTQDECLFLVIRRYEGKMRFDGGGSYFGGYEKRSNLSPEELDPKLMKDSPSPEELSICFTNALKQELAHYLANEELSDLGQHLDKV